MFQLDVLKKCKFKSNMSINSWNTSVVWQVIVEQRWLGSKLINCLDLCQKYKRRGRWWTDVIGWELVIPVPGLRPQGAARDGQVMIGRSWLLGSWQPILDTPATWELPRRPCWTLLNNLGSKKEPKKLIWWDASHDKNANSLLNLRSGMLSKGRI